MSLTFSPVAAGAVVATAQRDPACPPVSPSRDHAPLPSRQPTAPRRFMCSAPPPVCALSSLHLITRVSLCSHHHGRGTEPGSLGPPCCGHRHPPTPRPSSLAAASPRHPVRCHRESILHVESRHVHLMAAFAHRPSFLLTLSRTPGGLDTVRVSVPLWSIWVLGFGLLCVESL